MKKTLFIIPILILCSCFKDREVFITLKNNCGKRLKVYSNELMPDTVFFDTTAVYDFYAKVNHTYKIEVKSIDDKLTHYTQTITPFKKDIIVDLHK